MKMKHLLAFFASFFCLSAMAQTNPSAAKQNQFILIIRSKADARPSAEAVQTNIKHWQEFMGGLAQSGKIAGGYRPANDGEVIAGTAKTAKKGPYIADGEVMSSILIINAADMAEAKVIAAKCPVYELGGSIEIRPIQTTAN